MLSKQTMANGPRCSHIHRSEHQQNPQIRRAAVRMLSEGMKIEQVCVRSAAVDCFCWRARSGEAPEECPEEAEVELPVESRGEVLGNREAVS